ncbi:unnamed protein product [Adineta steineri]|uniref:Uncharacterized protein n=1 Tax=Adineta steineri TaxID=433720 RepID=A0A814G0P5_9BILA|nr:unnamed protein product [Adineta steineri]CAF0994755.1 unnamed protein product [Adineta steineri]
MNFRRNNISLIPALPAFTQCYDGTILGLLELYGELPKDNLFCKIFDICNSTDRQDRNGKGWFVTRDGFSYTPDSLNFDERMPNLMPYLDYNKLMNISSAIHHNDTQHSKDLVEVIEMQELSLINILNFLINQNIVDKDTHIAITSWTTWPIEIGQQTNELRSGGMAHTANEIFE